jgi:hypothetical protein
MVLISGFLPTSGADMQYVIPMYESERGWGSKIDGYAGPFNSSEEAFTFMHAYNRKYNSESIVPDYYIAALDPVVFKGQKCDYRTDNV